jgi:hypothetical protein
MVQLAFVVWEGKAAICICCTCGKCKTHSRCRSEHCWGRCARARRVSCCLCVLRAACRVTVQRCLSRSVCHVAVQTETMSERKIQTTSQITPLIELVCGAQHRMRDVQTRRRTQSAHRRRCLLSCKGTTRTNARKEAEIGISRSLRPRCDRCSSCTTALKLADFSSPLVSWLPNKVALLANVPFASLLLDPTGGRPYI